MQCCIDSWGSRRMRGDKKKNVKIRKEKEGSIIFGNDNSAKIIGKGTMTLGNRDTQENHVFLRHTLLSVIHMCGQGHTLTFNSK